MYCTNYRSITLCAIVLLSIFIILTVAEKKRDYYEVLGLPKDAPDSQIVKKFRQLAKKYHPDNPETGDEKKYVELTEAYDVLHDEDKRAHYDRYGHSDNTLQPTGAQGGFPFGFGDIFSSFNMGGDGFFRGFGGAGSKPGGGNKGGSRGRTCYTTTRCVNGQCTTTESCS